MGLMSEKRIERLGIALAYLCLVVWLLAVALPFAWVLVTSTRSTEEIFRSPFGLPEHFQQSAGTNYANAWVKSNFSGYFLNSLMVVSASLVLLFVIACPAAYALARYKSRTFSFLLVYFLSGMMIPVQLLLVPLFFQYKDWSLVLTRWGHPLLSAFGMQHTVISLADSHPGLVILYVALSLSFTLFVLTSFFRTLPGELYEAGIMDGCGEFHAFFDVMLPLAKPGVVTAAIFNFIGLWNEYFLALVFINSEKYKTLPLGLASVSIQANYRSDFGLLFAGLVIVMLPTLVVYVFLQRHLTEGITMGALKG
jgi:ABC-type glycerol-3-phosphate transport system permease component